MRSTAAATFCLLLNEKTYNIEIVYDMQSAVANTYHGVGRYALPDRWVFTNRQYASSSLTCQLVPKCLGERLDIWV